ncbi:hypothetical protein B0J14DRAFT_647723 [Halenospora varia]|nr:hypothetical protein B0J14DRAFT_647723 [Halenospora varia]
MKFPEYKPKPKPGYKPSPSYEPKPYKNGYNTTATATLSEYKPYYPSSSVATTTSNLSSSFYYVSSTSDVASSTADVSSSSTDYISSTSDIYSSTTDISSSATETSSLKPYYPYSTRKEYIPYPTAYYPKTLSTKTKAPYYKPTPKPAYFYKPGYKSSNSDVGAFESNSEVVHGNGTTGHGYGHCNHGLEIGAVLYWLLVLCGIAIGVLIITGVGLKVGRKRKEGRRENRERRETGVRFTERPAGFETSEVSKLV